MSTFHEEDQEVQKLMGQAPASQDAPIELRAKLRLMAANAGTRSPSKWPARLAVAGVGVVAIVVFSLSMAPSRAWSFQKIVDAVDHANSFQFSVVTPNQGEDQKVLIGVDNGKFILHAGDALMQIDGSKFEIYDPKDNSVVEMSFGNMIDPNMIADKINQGLKEGMKEMDIKKMMSEFEGKYGKDNIHVGPIIHRFGKSTYTVDMKKPDEPEQIHMIVNADTDLPQHIEISKARGEGDNEDAVIDLQFGGALDPSLTNFHIPANAKHVDLDFGKMMQEGLSGMAKGMNGDELGKKIEESFGGPGRKVDGDATAKSIMEALKGVRRKDDNSNGK